MAEQDNTPLVLTSRATTEAEKAWLAHYAEEQRKTPARLEEVAKYLAGIISISLTIFIDKRPPNLQIWTQGTLTTAAVFWMLSAFLSFIVLFPWWYRYHAQSPDSIEQMHQRLVRVKFILLIASVVFYLVALAAH